MAEYIRLTEQTLHWFQSLLPPAHQTLREQEGFFILGAVQAGVACGTLVFQLQQPAEVPMANIRFLAVAEGYRRRGIATGLIRFLCRCCYDSVTPVLCTFSAPDKTDPVYLLFAEMEDFSVAEAEGYVCQIPLSCLAGDPTLASLAERGRQPRRLFDLSAAARRSLLLDLKRRGPFYLQAGDEEALVKPLCLYTRDSDHVTAALFFSRDGTDLELSFAWSAPGGQRDLMGLLGRVAVQFSAGSRGMLRIAAVSPASAAIVDKLLPGREITARFYQAAWDMELLEETAAQGEEDDHAFAK